MTSLPTSCPTLTGKWTPGIIRACRFAPDLLDELVEAQLLNSSSSCPLSSACQLMSLWPRAQQAQERQHHCLGTPCAHGDYRRHDGLDHLWCHQAQEPVIELGACPLGSWIRNEAGHPRRVFVNQPERRKP